MLPLLFYTDYTPKVDVITADERPEYVSQSNLDNPCVWVPPLELCLPFGVMLPFVPPTPLSGEGEHSDESLRLRLHAALTGFLIPTASNDPFVVSGVEDLLDVKHQSNSSSTYFREPTTSSVSESR